MVRVKLSYLIGNHAKGIDRGPDVPKTQFSSVKRKKDCGNMRCGIWEVGNLALLATLAGDARNRLTIAFLENAIEI